jgi:hypothetical protein
VPGGICGYEIVRKGAMGFGDGNVGLPELGPEMPTVFPRGIICRLDARAWPRAGREDLEGFDVLLKEKSSAPPEELIETMEMDRLCLPLGRISLEFGGCVHAVPVEPDRRRELVDGTLRERADRCPRPEFVGGARPTVFPRPWSGETSLWRSEAGWLEDNFD